MKKWLITILVLVVLFFAAIYFFLPRTVHDSHEVVIKANIRGVTRNILNEHNWLKWWPGKVSSDTSLHFEYAGKKYSITDKKLSSVNFFVTGEHLSAVGVINFIPESHDSVSLQIETASPLPSNPFSRLLAYFNTKNLSGDMDVLLEKMKVFYSSNDNVYGFPVREEKVVDSTLISTFSMSMGYPGTDLVYGLIDDLKKYIIANSAKETGYPMLNVSTGDSLHFLTRVAIPVDKPLPTKGNISYKWMLGGGNILITEVKGGPGTLRNALQQVENYSADHNRVPPAIPFFSMVTDRRQEPDTAKWVTRIYFPVE
jgi:hypothetical protein